MSESEVVLAGRTVAGAEYDAIAALTIMFAGHREKRSFPPALLAPVTPPAKRVLTRLGPKPVPAAPPVLTPTPTPTPLPQPQPKPVLTPTVPTTATTATPKSKSVPEPVFVPLRTEVLIIKPGPLLPQLRALQQVSFKKHLTFHPHATVEVLRIVALRTVVFALNELPKHPAIDDLINKLKHLNSICQHIIDTIKVTGCRSDSPVVKHHLERYFAFRDVVTDFTASITIQLV